MVVQHNMQAANANRMLNLTVNGQQKSTEKLSSGYRINRAADDAAGLAISEKMRSQIRGLDRASTNAQDGISVVQTAEGALNEVHSMLQRMNELATQAANDTNTTNDRKEIQLEVDQLTSEIDRVASTTQFNTMNLLDGSFTGKNLQVGSLSGQTIQLDIGAMNAKALGLAGTKTVANTNAPTQHGYVTAISGGSKNTAVADADDWASINVSSLKDGTYEYDKQNKVWHNTNDPTDNFADIKLPKTVDISSTENKPTLTVANGKVTASNGINKAGVDLTKANATGTISETVTNGTYKADSTGKFYLDGDSAKGELAGVTLKDADGHTLTAKEGATITIAGQKAAVTNATGSTTQDLKLNVTTHDGAEDAMTRVQDAIDHVSSQRATLGAVQNRLEHTIANLDTTSENTQAAESRIRDTDMAKEMVTWSKNNILAQAGQSMLAQANQSNQGVLSLLQ